MLLYIVEKRNFSASRHLYCLLKIHLIIGRERLMVLLHRFLSYLCYFFFFGHICAYQGKNSVLIVQKYLFKRKERNLNLYIKKTDPGVNKYFII